MAEASVVRRLAPTCYLCGSAKSTDAEHVHPKARGGSNLWTNMAGACGDCNLDKRAKVGDFSDGQLMRAAEQQVVFRTAHSRSTLDVAILGINYRGWWPEELMADGLLDLDLPEDVAMRFFPQGRPKDDGTGLLNSKYGFVMRF
ncbi:HNH endonuclease [Micromonospora arborensis]|uniref:HNH endonuclease n=1 Tax=Micromonospora arborensis TaxID=2116518 RepID=UPI0033E1736D